MGIFDQECAQSMATFLQKVGRLPLLIGRYYENREDRSFWFEVAFAYSLEEYGYNLAYEVSANPLNDTSVDFRLECHGSVFYFELLRIEDSDAIRKHIDKQRKQGQLFAVYEVLLSSSHSNPYFKTAAQIIRLQEKVLDKVDRFPEPRQDQFSIMAVDCSKVHEGMLDEEDVRIAMFGRSQEAAFQEYWQGARLRGMFEDIYDFKGSDAFRRKISAVIFVPELELEQRDLFREAMIVVNPRFGPCYAQALLQHLGSLKPFQSLCDVKARKDYFR